MTPLGNLQYDNNLFDFEETNIYGIYEPHGYMTWYIEMFPDGEDNYIMFNSLVFDNIFSPQQLSDVTIKETSDTGDLYEHTVRVNGEDRFLKSIDMAFGKWDTENQSIQITGHGTIDADDNLPEVVYKFNAVLRFKELDIFETTKEATQKFVDTYLQDTKDKLEINFENVASGLQAIISGHF
ncbi:MAG: hypothetical protein ACXVMS_12195 [Flavisolibacter sp.]